MRPCTNTPDLGSDTHIIHKLSLEPSAATETSWSIVIAGSLTVLVKGATSLSKLFDFLYRFGGLSLLLSESESTRARLRCRSTDSARRFRDLLFTITLLRLLLGSLTLLDNLSLSLPVCEWVSQSLGVWLSSWLAKAESTPESVCSVKWWTSTCNCLLSGSCLVLDLFFRFGLGGKKFLRT